MIDVTDLVKSPKISPYQQLWMAVLAVIVIDALKGKGRCEPSHDLQMICDMAGVSMSIPIKAAKKKTESRAFRYLQSAIKNSKPQGQTYGKIILRRNRQKPVDSEGV